jgi:hypothetical protein
VEALGASGLDALRTRQEDRTTLGLLCRQGTFLSQKRLAARAQPSASGILFIADACFCEEYC